MFKSMWRVWLEIYQGADVIVRREIDWKASIVFNCDGLAQPHIWAPYDQIGRSIALYKINLLWSGSLDFSTGRSRCSLEFSDFLLFLRWGPQVNLLSKIIPRYFTWDEEGIGISWRVGVGRFFLFRVKGTWTDLAALILIFQLEDHLSIRSRWFWRALNATVGFLSDDRIAVSSA